MSYIYISSIYLHIYMYVNLVIKKTESLVAGVGVGTLEDLEGGMRYNKSYTCVEKEYIRTNFKIFRILASIS